MLAQVLPGSTPADRIASFAKSLTQRFTRYFPTAAFIGSFAKATKSSFATKNELVSFLTANPNFDLRRTNVDQFISSNKLTISPAALSELK
jgi:hypothetical protein